MVLPAYNERSKIGKVVRKIKKDVPAGCVDRVLVVDDGSTDDTAVEAENEGALVIRKPDNEGVGAAIREGITFAQDNDFSVIVVMAGDDQDSPSELPDIVDPILRGECDFVQGSRRLLRRQTPNIPLFRRVTTKFYSLIFRLITGFPCTDGTNGFRAFTVEFTRDRRMNLNQPWLKTYELEPYLFYHAVRLGYRVREVQVTKSYHRKAVGYSKMIPGRDWWNIIKPLFYLKLGLRR